MTNIFRFLSLLWILTGLNLGVWSTKWMYQSYQYFHFISSGFKASMIGLSYAMLAIIAAIGVLLRKRWGRFLLNAVSVLGILYVIMFMLLQGYLDRSLLYSIGVITLCVVSIFSLISINAKTVKKGYFTQQGNPADSLH
jgi:hypothetical protein